MRIHIGAAALVIAAIIGLAAAFASNTSAQETAPPADETTAAAQTCVAAESTRNGAARTTADPSLASYDAETRTVSYAGVAAIDLYRIPEDANPDGKYVSSAFIVGGEAIRIVASANSGVLGIIAARAVTDCGENVWPRFRWYVSNFVEAPPQAVAPPADDESMMQPETESDDLDG